MRKIKVENYVDVNCTYKSKNHVEFYLKEKVNANLIFFAIIIVDKFDWKEVVLCQQ